MVLKAEFLSPNSSMGVMALLHQRVRGSSIVGRKGHGRLRGGGPRKQQRHNDGNKSTHAANVPALARQEITYLLSIYCSVIAAALRAISRKPLALASRSNACRRARPSAVLPDFISISPSASRD